MNKKKQESKKRDGIISMLKSRYGIDEDTTGEIIEALNGGYEDENMTDISSEQEDERSQRIKFLEEENANIKKQIQDAMGQKKMQSTISSWLGDAKILSEEFEDFDLEREVENPTFQNLLRSGIDLKTAYYAMHHSDILKNAVNKAAEDARLKITDSIRARGVRPGENGLNDKSTATFKKDVSKLTPEERALIAARARRGEKISF